MGEQEQCHWVTRFEYTVIQWNIVVLYSPAFVKTRAYGRSVIRNSVEQTVTTFTIVGVVTDVRMSENKRFSS